MLVVFEDAIFLGGIQSQYSQNEASVSNNLFCIQMIDIILTSCIIAIITFLGGLIINRIILKKESRILIIFIRHSGYLAPEFKLLFFELRSASTEKSSRHPYFIYVFSGIVASIIHLTILSFLINRKNSGILFLLVCRQRSTRAVLLFVYNSYYNGIILVV